MKLLNYTMQDGNIHLRLIEENDKEAYYKAGFLEEDEEVRFYTGTTEYFTKETVENYIDKIIMDESRYDFLIMNAEKEILGEAVLNEIDDEGRMAGFRICLFQKEFFGKGYGTLALQMVIRFAFETLKLHRVELEVYEYNHRAKHTYEKAGFVHEGTKKDGLFYGGKYYDVVMMAMLECDYHRKG